MHTSPNKEADQNPKFHQTRGFNLLLQSAENVGTPPGKKLKFQCKRPWAAFSFSCCMPCVFLMSASLRTLQELIRIVSGCVPLSPPPLLATTFYFWKTWIQITQTNWSLKLRVFYPISVTPSSTLLPHPFFRNPSHKILLKQEVDSFWSLEHWKRYPRIQT